MCSSPREQEDRSWTDPHIVFADSSVADGSMLTLSSDFVLAAADVPDLPTRFIELMRFFVNPGIEDMSDDPDDSPSAEVPIRNNELFHSKKWASQNHH